MKTENAILMKQARESLAGKWKLAIGAFVIYELILIAIQEMPKIGWAASLIIAGPMALGMSIFSLSLSRNQEPKLEQIFKGFERFGVALSAYLLTTIFVVLWSLLLLIPGIMAGYSYAMAFYILADDKSIGAMEAIDRSKRMMYGSRWKLFYLSCRFIGWGLLCILTLGIGFLWLIPYTQISIAKFYDDLKADQTPAENPQEQSA